MLSVKSQDFDLGKSGVQGSNPGAKFSSTNSETIMKSFDVIQG